MTSVLESPAQYRTEPAGQYPASPYEVEIPDFASIPEVHSWGEFCLAAGSLATERTAYVLRLDPEDEELAKELTRELAKFDGPDPTRLALQAEIKKASRDLSWQSFDTAPVWSSNEPDRGFYTDLLSPWDERVIRDYRVSPDCEFELILAKALKPVGKEDSHRLAALLDKGMTDKRFADPKSFSRVTFNQGGGRIVFSSVSREDGHLLQLPSAMQRYQMRRTGVIIGYDKTS